MQKLFSTVEGDRKKRFEAWWSFCDERLTHLEQSRTNDAEFKACIQGLNVGDLYLSRCRFEAVKLQANRATIRHPTSKPESLFLNLKIAGRASIAFGDDIVEQEPGDFSIYDTSEPIEINHAGAADQLVIELPRNLLEQMLGPTRNFSRLSMQKSLPTTVLLRTFLGELTRVGGSLGPDAARRMSTVGLELIIASIAERMAVEVPSNLRSTVIVQRAKSYIASRLYDAELNSAKIATALSVSRRYLQELFRERGRNVGD